MVHLHLSYDNSVAQCSFGWTMDWHWCIDKSKLLFCVRVPQILTLSSILALRRQDPHQSCPIHPPPPLDQILDLLLAHGTLANGVDAH